MTYPMVTVGWVWPIYRWVTRRWVTRRWVTVGYRTRTRMNQNQNKTHACRVRVHQGGTRRLSSGSEGIGVRVGNEFRHFKVRVGFAY